MVKVKKLKPMSLKRLNILLSDTGYQLEKSDDGEVMMVGTAKKQVQPNLLAHLKKEG